jgi:hypothetical protein
MQSIATTAPSKPHSTPKLSPQRQTPPQPLDVISVPGALLRLETLAAISGRSVNTLFRDASKDRGLLVLTKVGPRCTRITSENAKAYLQRLAGGAV